MYKILQSTHFQMIEIKDVNLIVVASIIVGVRCILLLVFSVTGVRNEDILLLVSLLLLITFPGLPVVARLVLRPLGRIYPWSMRPAGALMTGDAVAGCKSRRIHMSDEVVG